MDNFVTNFTVFIPVATGNSQLPSIIICSNVVRLRFSRCARSLHVCLAVIIVAAVGTPSRDALAAVRYRLQRLVQRVRFNAHRATAAAAAPANGRGSRVRRKSIMIYYLTKCSDCSTRIYVYTRLEPCTDSALALADKYLIRGPCVSGTYIYIYICIPLLNVEKTPTAPVLRRKVRRTTRRRRV